MIFTVPAISCGHCKAAIETALAGAGGNARVDIAARTVEVEGLDRDSAVVALREAGYEVTTG